MIKLALVDRLRRLPKEERARIYASLSNRELAALRWAWRDFWARPDERDAGDAREGRGQLRPARSPARWWALMGGRAGGKTEGAARYIYELSRLGQGVIIHVLGQTIEDAIATQIRGVSGLEAVSPPWSGFKFSASGDGQGGTFEWANGARGRVFGAERPRKGRGPQCNAMWIDDPAAFGGHGRQVAEQLDLGFRLRLPNGDEPRGVISSTWQDSDVMAWIREQRSLVLSRCTTDDNRANLAETFFTEALAGIEGTDLEAIERHGKDPSIIKRRVFAPVEFGKCRAAPGTIPERFKSIAVWIDPALATTEKACEVGIIAGGLTYDGRAILLEDASGVLNAMQWPERAHEALERWAPLGDEHHFGVETNKAEAQAEALLRMAEMVRRQERGLPKASVIQIITVHTAIGKPERAQEIVRLYLTGQVLHVAGLEVLEGQLHELDETIKGGPGRDRADAGVYLVLDFFGILHKVRPGYVGGGQVQPGTYGRQGIGSVVVGSMGGRAEAPPAAGAAVFSFGGGGRFSGGTFT